MAKKRIARVNEQMKRELTALLRFEVRDPRIGMVTVTDVETSPDLYHAKVYVAITGEADDREKAMAGLRAAGGYLRGEIGRRMHIRRAPELHFTVDETLEHAMHIERLLREARAGSASEGDDADADFDDDDYNDGELAEDDELVIEVELEDDEDDDEGRPTH